MSERPHGPERGWMDAPLAPDPHTEPRTPSGQRILNEWLMLKPDYPPNTARVRDMIVACEAEASTGADAPPPLDVELLEAIENVLYSDPHDADDPLHWQHLREVVAERRARLAAPPEAEK